MNWSVEGSLKWQAIGLSSPQIILDQLEQYQNDMTTVSDHIAENLILQPESKLQSSVLYDHYNEWCRSMGYAFVDQRDFKSSLKRTDGVSYGLSKNDWSFNGLEYQDKAA